MTPDDNARRLENDIRETVAAIYGPLQRQASDGAALVALAVFISIVALWAQIIIDVAN